MELKRKILLWIVIFLLIIAVCVVIYLVAGRTGERTIASIYVDGELYEQIDLSAVAVPYEITVETDAGYNTIRVSHGAIQVVSADCPGQDCVRQGEITDSLIPIVCLPHKLVIQIEEPS